MHLLCLAVCVLMVALTIYLNRRWKGTERMRKLHQFVGYGCVVVWVIYAIYAALPSRFSWHHSIPLHFCNMANLIGAVAVLRRQRLFQSVIYFWTFALCIWAFLTPTLLSGPFHFGFWIFYLTRPVWQSC